MLQENGIFRCLDVFESINDTRPETNLARLHRQVEPHKSSMNSTNEAVSTYKASADMSRKYLNK